MEEISGENTWSDYARTANLKSQRSMPFSPTKTLLSIFVSKLIRTMSHFRISARGLHSHMGFTLKKYM